MGCGSRVAGALLVLALLCVPYAAAGSDVEADAIHGVFDDWSGYDAPVWRYWQRGTFDNVAAMVELDGLYVDASPACRGFITSLYASFALIESGRYSPVNHLGAQTGFLLLLNNLDAGDYACRIAA